jgi:MerR family mercuric resistance operon transcriptional regulator
MGTPLSIGALAKRSGVNVETIRYYEKIGVMPAPNRTGAGYRVYGEEHVKRLHFVRRGRELGFGLNKLRGLFASSGRRRIYLRGGACAYDRASRRYSP